MGYSRCVIFAGPCGAADRTIGPASATSAAKGAPGLSALPRPGDLVLCADAGYISCKAAGIRPDAVIGDFDSLPAENIGEIDEAGIRRIVHPARKDETDTLLCVKYGLAQGIGDFLIIGGIGGDFGHTVANLQVLSYIVDMGCKGEITTENERILMTDGEAEFEGRAGAKFSVLSYSERSEGVCIKNAKYELADATLTQSYPIGVSNEFMEKGPVNVSVRRGRLLVVASLD